MRVEPFLRFFFYFFLFTIVYINHFQTYLLKYCRLKPAKPLEWTLKTTYKAIFVYQSAPIVYTLTLGWSCLGHKGTGCVDLGGERNTQLLLEPSSV